MITCTHVTPRPPTHPPTSCSGRVRKPNPTRLIAIFPLHELSLGGGGCGGVLYCRVAFCERFLMMRRWGGGRYVRSRCYALDVGWLVGCECGSSPIILYPECTLQLRLYYAMVGVGTNLRYLPTHRKRIANNHRIQRHRALVPNFLYFPSKTLVSPHVGVRKGKRMKKRVKKNNRANTS